jgi:hypothetical protein
LKISVDKNVSGCATSDQHDDAIVRMNATATRPQHARAWMGISGPRAPFSESTLAVLGADHIQTDTFKSGRRARQLANAAFLGDWTSVVQ